MADMGTEALETVFPPNIPGTQLHFFTKAGIAIATLLQQLKRSYNESLVHSLREKDGIMSRGFLHPDRNQDMLARAKRLMTPTERRRLLQCLGGVFPCNAWLHRINIASSPLCPLCGHTDHYSHRVLTCCAVSDAITAAHNKAWTTLYDLLTSHLPVGVLD
jgi:hypothetical protein